MYFTIFILETRGAVNYMLSTKVFVVILTLCPTILKKMKNRQKSVVLNVEEYFVEEKLAFRNAVKLLKTSNNSRFNYKPFRLSKVN